MEIDNARAKSRYLDPFEAVLGNLEVSFTASSGVKGSVANLFSSANLRGGIEMGEALFTLGNGTVG